MKYHKVYIEVLVKFPSGGGMLPVALRWTDGARYEVQKVRFVDHVPAHVSAILPVRYTCVVEGKERFLWYEREGERWFVEAVG